MGKFTATFQQSEKSRIGGCHPGFAVAEAVRAVYEATVEAGSLSFALPSPTLPACGDFEFRAFASEILTELPGLPFFVFGGDSPQARDLFLATLENVTAVSDSTGKVLVQFDLEEDRKSQFQADPDFGKETYGCG